MYPCITFDSYIELWSQELLLGVAVIPYHQLCQPLGAAFKLHGNSRISVRLAASRPSPGPHATDTTAALVSSPDECEWVGKDAGSVALYALPIW